MNTTLPKINSAFCFQELKEQNVYYLFILESPPPRVGCAIATDNKNVYVFGGKDEDHRFDDIWSFGLTDYKFKKLKDDGEVPAIRNGHTMNYFD